MRFRESALEKRMLRNLWAACAAAAMLSPIAALAHAKLLGTSPAAGAQLDVSPKALTLRFDENVQLAVLKLSAGGTDIPVPFDRSAQAAPEVSVALPSLAPGTYRVQWSALTADDGHVVKGTFSFVVTAR
jgi:methionine-rich copper-binding protein CopC